MEVPKESGAEGVGQSKALSLLTFGLPAVLAVAFMVVWLTFYTGVQGTVASVGGLLPLGYAVTAGMVASVNPCGFFMLPSYLSFFLGSETPAFQAQ
ncbi:MAG: hypothetical protein HYX99_03300 [Chloroflexi bacterium]|nr:hypothetical protein [Chloroflexota bacterium]